MSTGLIDNRARARVSVFVVLLLSAGATACKHSAPSSSMTDRQMVVAEMGAMVMPFDLDRSTHVFDKQDFGGVQRVVSDDGDESQIDLIRQHLSEEALRFAKGDFHDPSMIHGEDMAGLHQLVLGHEKVAVTYSEIESGAQIVYKTEDPELVAAIHSWFDAQVSDHGAHARAGH